MSNRLINIKYCWTKSSLRWGSWFCDTLKTLKMLGFKSFCPTLACTTPYDTPNPVYILEFTTISSSNSRRKCSPIQCIKSTRSQNNSVDHILCNQWYCFLSKDIKSTNFVDKYPSFLWNLLVGKHLPKVYSGVELWHMIPTTMHPWWFDSLIDSSQ